MELDPETWRYTLDWIERLIVRYGIATFAGLAIIWILSKYRAWPWQRKKNKAE